MGMRPGLLLTAIATSKTTVVGLRLDHDRRAWVDAEAAREGVTVRVLFERMIDRARVHERLTGSIAGERGGVEPDVRPDGIATEQEPISAAADPADMTGRSANPPTAPAPPGAPFRSLPEGGLSGEAIALAIALLRATTRCAQWGLRTARSRVCVVRRPGRDI